MTNSDCTLYKYDEKTQGYIRHFIEGVYWQESKGANVVKSGLQSVDSTVIFLFFDTVLPQSPTKDMFVKDKCDFEFDNTSPQTISESMNTFCKSNVFVTVSAIDNKMYGGLPHIEISAK